MPDARKHLWAGLVLAAALGLFFRLTPFDLAWSSHFYSAAEPHWPLHDWGPFRWLHDSGEWPGRLLGLGSLAALTASFLPSWKKWRRTSLYLSLVFLLGPGLIVNGFGKALVGRPRPYAVREFGGTHAFVPLMSVGLDSERLHGLIIQKDEVRSFPSGHASMAFIFMALYFVLPGWKGKAAFAGALLFGLIMSVARVSQGDHFPSDTLLSGAMLYCLAAALAGIVMSKEKA